MEEAKREISPEEIWDGFENLIRSGRRRHPDEESAVEAACRNASNHFNISITDARQLYAELKERFG